MITNSRILKRPTCFIPYRYITALLLSFGCMFGYTMYGSFKTAFSHQHERIQNFTQIGNYSLHCKFFENVTEEVHFGKNAYHHWDPGAFVMIYLANSWGHLIATIPSGIYSDKQGGKYLFCIPLLVYSVVQIVVPHVLTGHDADFLVFFFWRFFSGVIIAMTQCSMNTILAHWTPLEDRGKLSCIAYCATQFAVTFQFLTTNNMVYATEMWYAAFYIYSGMTVIWFVLFIYFGYSYYFSKNQWMTEKEFKYLGERLKELSKNKKIPWLKLLTSVPLWALLIAHFGHVWIWHVMSRIIPFYLRAVLYYDVHTTDYIGASMYMMLGCFTVLNGFIADFLTNRQYVQLITLRKVYTTIGAVGPPIFLIAATYTGCHRLAAIVMFFCGLTLMSCYYGGTLINTLELAPNFSGTIIGFMNLFNVIPSMVIPKLGQIIAPHQTIAEARILLWVHLAVLGLTTIVYAFFGSSDVQSWNYIDDEEEEEDTDDIGRVPSHRNYSDNH